MGVEACDMLINGSTELAQVPVQPLEGAFKSVQSEDGQPRHWAFVYQVFDSFFGSVNASMNAVMSYVQGGSVPPRVPSSDKSSPTVRASSHEGGEGSVISKANHVVERVDQAASSNTSKNNGRQDWDQTSIISCASFFNRVNEELLPLTVNDTVQEEAKAVLFNTSENNANARKDWSRLPTGVCRPTPRNINRVSSSSGVSGPQVVNRVVNEEAVVREEQSAAAPRNVKWKEVGRAIVFGVLCAFTIAGPIATLALLIASKVLVSPVIFVIATGVFGLSLLLGVISVIYSACVYPRCDE